LSTSFFAKVIHRTRPLSFFLKTTSVGCETWRFLERPFSGQDVTCRVGWRVGQNLSTDDGLMEDRNWSVLCPLIPSLLPFAILGQQCPAALPDSSKAYQRESVSDCKAFTLGCTGHRVWRRADFTPPWYGLKCTVERNKAFRKLGLQHTIVLHLLLMVPLPLVPSPTLCLCRYHSLFVDLQCHQSKMFVNVSRS
jgi:hypothetical protein